MPIVRLPKDYTNNESSETNEIKKSNSDDFSYKNRKFLRDLHYKNSALLNPTSFAFPKP